MKLCDRRGRERREGKVELASHVGRVVQDENACGVL